MFLVLFLHYVRTPTKYGNLILLLVFLSLKDALTLIILVSGHKKRCRQLIGLKPENYSVIQAQSFNLEQAGCW